MLIKEMIIDRWEEYRISKSFRDLGNFIDLLNLNARKDRLAAVAIARLPKIAAQIPAELDQKALIVAEHFADNYSRDGIPLLNKCNDEFWNKGRGLNHTKQICYGIVAVTCRVESSSYPLIFSINQCEPLESRIPVLEDIFDKIIFKTVRLYEISPEHKTSTAIALAQQIYDSKDWGTMPILADALQDAGFNNSEVLDQLRDTKSYWFRGCDILDQIIGKE